jgi:hypothetical protein
MFLSSSPAAESPPAPAAEAQTAEAAPSSSWEWPASTEAQPEAIELQDVGIPSSFQEEAETADETQQGQPQPFAQPAGASAGQPAPQPAPPATTGQSLDLAAPASGPVKGFRKITDLPISADQAGQSEEKPQTRFVWKQLDDE